MKNSIILLILAGMCLLIFILKNEYFIVGSNVEAAGDLYIDLGFHHSGEPLFRIENMSPGASTLKQFIVYNDANTDRSVGVKAVKTLEKNNLSKGLIITISSKGKDLYGGGSGKKTLEQFFSESSGVNGIFLSTIPQKEKRSYTVAVEFPYTSGNEFQSGKLTFDLHVGVSIPIPQKCQHLKLSDKPIYGTRSRDSLIGTNANDLIIGFEGNDTIDGRGGDDCILGGDGYDIVKGGKGKDICEGEFTLSCEL